MEAREHTEDVKGDVETEATEELVKVPDAVKPCEHHIAETEAERVTNTTTASHRNVVQLGRHVLLADTNGLRMVFMLRNQMATVSLGKNPSIPNATLLSLPYGATIRWNGKCWQRSHRCSDKADSGGVEHRTNQYIVQDGTAQSLTSGDCESLKKELVAEDYINVLVQNNANFEQRHEFSQDKIKNRKLKKLLHEIQILEPTLMQICETYASNEQKSCGIRFDYLSSILTKAGVRRDGRYIVFDEASGLVTGAVAQRLGGTGRVYRLFVDSSERSKLLDELDLCEEVLSTIRKVRFAHLTNYKNSKEMTPSIHAYARELIQNLVDGMIIVPRHEAPVEEVLTTCLDYLSPGGQIVVYSQDLTPQAHRQAAMQASTSFVNVKLIQLFLREYQVLPMRTHPFMTEGHVSPGFILSATKVCDDASFPSSDNLDRNAKVPRLV